MKKVFIGVLAACLLLACTPKQQSEEQAIRELCTYMVEQYPNATLQDMYKTCYQDFFGAEHLLRDTATAHRYLSAEIDACAGQDLSTMPSCEPTGYRHRFTRINLSEVVTGRMSEEELFTQFVTAAAQENALSEDWAAEWQRIESVALSLHPAWRDTTLQAELHQAAELKSAVRHSESFRKTYNPHYRIVPNINTYQ
jgi:hypothetical protein